MAGFSSGPGTDSTPTTYYAIAAFTYLTAMVSSNKALLWVNYPTQVIGKSCKPIPVMILGKLVAVYPKNTANVYRQLSAIFKDKFM